jgi:hypothetical protein
MHQDFTPEVDVTVTPRNITVDRKKSVDVEAVVVNEPFRELAYRVEWSVTEGTIVKADSVLAWEDDRLVAHAEWNLGEADEGTAAIDAQVQVFKDDGETILAEATGTGAITIGAHEMSIELEVDEADAGFSLTEGDILHVIGRVKNARTDLYKYRTEIEVEGGARLIKLEYQKSGARFDAFFDTEGLERGEYDINARVYTLVKKQIVEGARRPRGVPVEKAELEPAIVAESASVPPAVTRTRPRVKKTTRRERPTDEGDE